MSLRIFTMLFLALGLSLGIGCGTTDEGDGAGGMGGAPQGEGGAGGEDGGAGAGGTGGVGDPGSGGDGGKDGVGEGGEGGETPSRVRRLRVEFVEACLGSCGSIRVGWTRQLEATALDADNQPIEDVDITWTSSNEAVVTVDANGKVTGVGEGNAVVVAQAEGKQSPAGFSVGPAQVGKIDVDPPTLALSVGETGTFEAAAWGLGPEENPTLPLPNAPIEWYVANPLVAEIVAPGKVRAIGPGATWIVAGSPDGIPAHEGHALLEVASDGPLPRGAAFETLSVGTSHTCGLRSDGETLCWGRNDQGQLGRGFLSDPMKAFPFPAPIYEDDPPLLFTTLAADLGQCGIEPNGMAWCWGNNGSGALGLGEDVPGSPVGLPVAGFHNFTAIDLGLGFGCALDDEKKAWCWGINGDGQVGIGVLGTDDLSNLDTWRIFEPVEVVGDHRFDAIAVGLSTVCALDEAGKAWCWGDNGLGTLGIGDEELRASGTPLAVATEETFTHIALGSNHACALTEDGEAWCWGRNWSLQLGGESPPRANPFQGEPASYAPQRVETELRFTDIVTGAFHTCAIDTEGAAWCWGNNEYGQCGSGVHFSRDATPRRVYGDLRFRSLHAGTHQTCGITVDGEAYCWGSNSFGILGGGFVDGSSPVPWPVAEELEDDED